MKAKYIKPNIEIIEAHVESQLLSDSVGVAGSTNQLAKPLQTDYTETTDVYPDMWNYSKVDYTY